MLGASVPSWRRSRWRYRPPDRVVRACHGAAGVARRFRAPLGLLALAVLIALVWRFVATQSERHGFFDLRVYYGAINYWVDGGGLYDYLSPDTRYGYTYPPFAALVMTPMALVGWHTAIAISIVASTLATLVVLYLYVAPQARRHGWNRLFALAVAATLVAALEPVRETVNFGQINMLMVFLVVADVLLLVRPGRLAAGVGVGLATAIKLTPGIFIVYLLLTRRWRAAGVAVATATVVTLAAAVAAPEATRVFLTEALVDTGRIGILYFISNQSWQGAVARLDPAAPNTALWLVLVLGTAALWAARIRAGNGAGRGVDDRGGLALTGALGCLISPVSWVHHLVWLVPALLLLAGRGYAARTAAGRARLVLAAGLYALLCSRLVWGYAFHFHGWGLLGSNAYVLAALVLLVAVPLGEAPAATGPEHGAGTAVDRRRHPAGALSPVVTGPV